MKKSFLERVGDRITLAAGSTGAILVALVVIMTWVLSGPIFHYSNTWQLVINTGTSIITFLMVFLIQKAQNKENRSLQLKLNELIASSQFASNRLISAEDIPEEELNKMYEHYRAMAEIAKKSKDAKRARSVEDTLDRIGKKKLPGKQR